MPERGSMDFCHKDYFIVKIVARIGISAVFLINQYRS